METKFKDFNELSPIALDDVMSLLNLALNRVHSCTGLTLLQKKNMVESINYTKNIVATATPYLPKGY